MKNALFLFVLLLAGQVQGSRFDCSLAPPQKRDQTKLVWSYAPLLTASEEQRLNGKLVQFARESSNQILVIIVDTLCGLPASDLAFELGQKWGVGQGDLENGIVILVKPTGPPGQRDVYIAVGYGLEGAIPDLAAKRVTEEQILARFREQQYFQGLNSGVDVLMAMARGEYDEQRHGSQDAPPAGALVLLFVIMLLVFLSWRGQVSRYARTNKVDFWTAMFLLSQMNKRHGRGGGGFGGGFGGGGFGGGGGGFGGFGGGGFGGGGAGGRW
jgi:uncharacterized protein